MRRLGVVALLVFCGCALEKRLGDADASTGDVMVDAKEIDGSPNVDTDGDGHLDAVDNCPMMANPTQHDEDTDNRGDVCDPCPHLMVHGGDADNDKIPDNCDPRPNTAGDTLVRFETFVGNALPAGWIVRAGPSGDFVVAGDALTINAAASTHVITFEANSRLHAIDIGVTIPASAITTFVTAMTDARSDIAAYFGCGVRVDTAEREMFRFESSSFSDLGSDPDPQDTPVFPGTYRIWTGVFATGQRCAVPSATLGHVMVSQETGEDRSHVGIRGGGAQFVVRYAAIYTF
jgi:hypothetical protein